MMGKLIVFIWILMAVPALDAANSGSYCRKSPYSQVSNTYPEMCKAQYDAGKCDQVKNKELSEKKSEALKTQLKSDELKTELEAIEAKYAKCSREEQNEAAKARTLGCLAGIESSLKEIILGVPQSLVDMIKDSRACQKDPDRKLKSIQEMNELLGEKYKYHVIPESDLNKPAFESVRRNRNFITKEDLSKISCLDLKHRIQMYKAKSWNQFSEQEKDAVMARMNANPSPSLMAQIQKMFSEMGLPSNCLAPKAYWEAVCIGAVEIGGAAVGGLAALKALRMARLATLTGKSTKELETKLAELQSLGKEGRIAKAKAEIEPLTAAQKSKLVQEELGLRDSLSGKQSAAIEKAHLEGSARGEGYGSYTGDTLREKKRILMSEGGFSEQQADYMINRGIVGNSTTTNGTMTIEKVKALNDEATKNRILGEMTSQQAGMRSGVVDKPDSQKYFQTAGKALEDQLAKDQYAQGLQKSTKSYMPNSIENYVIDKDMEFPKDRPDIAKKYQEFERNVIPTQRKFEEAATSYIRAGKKEEALRVLQKSPVVSNLSNGVGKQNYINRFLKETEVNRSPASK